MVKTGPVKEVVKLHNEADWTELPIPFHKDKDAAPYVTAMNIIRDPETGFYNSCHAGTHAVGPRRGLVSFVTPHSHVIMRKYREHGRRTRCRSPSCSACRRPTRSWPTSPACTWTAWGEMEMVGTIMDRDVEMVPCETLELNVPARGRDRGRGPRQPRRQVQGRRRHLALDVSPAALREPAGGRDHRDHHARRPADLPQPPDHARTPTISRCRGSVTRRCSTIG